MNITLCKYLLLYWGVCFLSYPALVAEAEDRPADVVDDGYDFPTRYSGEVDVPPPAPSAHHMGIGAQVLVQSNPYRDGDTVTLVLPMISYVGERFFIVSPRAGIHLFRHPLGGVNVIAGVNYVF